MISEAEADSTGKWWTALAVISTRRRPLLWRHVAPRVSNPGRVGASGSEKVARRPCAMGRALAVAWSLVSAVLLLPAAFGALPVRAPSSGPLAPGRRPAAVTEPTAGAREGWWCGGVPASCSQPSGGAQGCPRDRCSTPVKKRRAPALDATSLTTHLLDAPMRALGGRRAVTRAAPAAFGRRHQAARSGHRIGQERDGDQVSRRSRAHWACDCVSDTAACLKNQPELTQAHWQACQWQAPGCQMWCVASIAALAKGTTCTSATGRTTGCRRSLTFSPGASPPPSGGRCAGRRWGGVAAHVTRPGALASGCPSLGSPLSRC